MTHGHCGANLTTADKGKVWLAVVRYCCLPKKASCLFRCLWMCLDPFRCLSFSHLAIGPLFLQWSIEVAHQSHGLSQEKGQERDLALALQDYVNNILMKLMETVLRWGLQDEGMSSRREMGFLFSLGKQFHKARKESMKSSSLAACPHWKFVWLVLEQAQSAMCVWLK